MKKPIWNIWQDIEYIDDTYAREVQSNLLKIILLITCILGFVSASLAVVGVLPFGMIYSSILYIYTAINIVAYRLIIE